jgi:hypothetical protein
MSGRGNARKGNASKRMAPGTLASTIDTIYCPSSVPVSRGAVFI